MCDLSCIVHTHTCKYTHARTHSLLLSSLDVCVNDPVFVRLIEGRSSDCLRHKLPAWILCITHRHTETHACTGAHTQQFIFPPCGALLGMEWRWSSLKFGVFQRVFFFFFTEVIPGVLLFSQINAYHSHLIIHFFTHRNRHPHTYTILHTYKHPTQVISSLTLWR